MIEITDLALASYYFVKKYKLVEVVKIKNSPNRQATFKFDMTPEEHSIKSLEYINSDFVDFDAAQRHLKKLIY